MTVAIPEVTDAVESRAARRRVARGKVTSSTYDTYNTRTRTRPQAQPRPRPQQQPAQPRPRDTTVNVRAPAPVSFGRNYQGVIMAEFLAAVVIIVAVPVAEGGSPAAKMKGSISPYDTGDLRQLVAAGLVYFVLALFSSGNSGRLSAWFGGLVLVGLAMNRLAHGEISAVVKTVSGQNAAPQETSSQDINT